MSLASKCQWHKTTIKQNHDLNKDKL